MLKVLSQKKVSLLVLAAVFVMAVAGVFELRKLDTTYNFRQFMPKDHPLYVADRDIKKDFSLSEELPVIVTMSLKPEARGTWLEPARVNLLKRATDFVSKVDGIGSTTSIVNVQSAANTKQGIQVSNLLSVVSPDQWKSRVLADPLLTPALISSDGRTASIFGNIGFLSNSKIQRILRTIRAGLPALQGASDVKVLVGGVVPIQADMARLIGKELHRFLVLAFLACLITLMLYFRTLSSTAICLILVGLSNIAALALMPLMGISFSVMSTTLPVLASITALAIGSHTLINVGNRWEATRSDPNPPSKLEVIGQVYRQLFLPNFLMALTTTIGFATLSWSEVPLIRDFARSISAGIMVSWLVITLTLPPLMALLPIAKPRKLTGSNARWALLAIRFKYYIFGAVALGAAALAIHGMPLNWSVQLFDDLPNVGSIQESANVVDRKLGGMVPLEVKIDIPNESDPWNDPARIAKLDQLLTSWRKLPSIGSAIGLPDFLHNARSIGKLDTRKSIAEVLFLYSLADGNPMVHYLTSDGSTRLSLRFHDVPADEMQKTVDRIRGDVVAAFPGAAIETGGMATMVHTLNAELSQDLITGLWQSLFWISLLLIFVFRSVRWSLIAAVPNLLAPLALLATMSLLRTPIKPAVAVIFSIALGVAYNNTVYLLARLKWLMKNTPPERGRLIERAWYQEGNPCLFSSLALFGGFAVFLGSYFSLNRVFGAYMLWSIGVGLFGDLIFLPVLLKILPSGFLGKIRLSEGVIMKKQSWTTFSIVAIMAAGLAVSPARASGPSADQILKDVAKKLQSKDEVATVKMTVIEANGDHKERKLQVSRMTSGDDQSVLVRLESPADLAGIGLLSVVKGKNSEQWLYLPSSKQTRRILSGRRKANFLDSELSYEDLGGGGSNGYKNTISRTEKDATGKPVTVIESDSSNPEGSYGKILTWVPKSDLASRVEYYDHSGILLKVMEMTDYKRFAGGVWRAEHVSVKNVQNNRGTLLDLSDLKLNQGLSASDFSPSALENP